MAKYDPLKQYLLRLPETQNETTLSFEQVEKITESKLPFSAYEHRAWWSNESHGVHVSAHAWMDAGWKVDQANQREHWVRFVRKRVISPEKTAHNRVNAVLNESRHKTTEFSANRPVRTLVIHKPECRVIPWKKLNPCGCGDRGELENQRWFCEVHITIKDVDEFMNGRFWAILLCDICFKGN